jgi:hypothetical protein
MRSGKVDVEKAQYWQETTRETVRSGRRRNTPGDVDSNHLPNHPAALPQRVRSLLEEVESQERRVKQRQHRV